ncbi:MAG: hypothetical protein NW217_10180 [Hyphomicrobiaceae bacterium]|nr:hypothetical protein [Hyphomicrobiaceae bacterium]
MAAMMTEGVWAKFGRAVAATLALAIVMSVPLEATAADPKTAEFEGMCPMGLAEGARRKTDCKVTWTDPAGKLFCFATEDAKTLFLQDPEGNLRKAREHLAMGEMQQTGEDMGRFTAEDVTAFVTEHIERTAAASGGLYRIDDAMAGQTLGLKFQAVDFVRTLFGYGFFPNVIFVDKDDQGKKYQIDFWVRPKDGKLSIVDVRVYKAPRREGDTWVMMTRLPKPWWWIPASEHPGKTEHKRGWEIMSALHDHIAAERAKGGGVYKMVDDKTGEELSLDFVGIHQPVRKLREDGRFFACTDFRKVGSQEEYYDIDFWLDEKDGSIKVGGVRLHKVPRLEDGNFIQMPRYSFNPKTFDVVP